MPSSLLNKVVAGQMILSTQHIEFEDDEEWARRLNDERNGTSDTRTDIFRLRLTENMNFNYDISKFDAHTQFAEFGKKFWRKIKSIPNLDNLEWMKR